MACVCNNTYKSCTPCPACSGMGGLKMFRREAPNIYRTTSALSNMDVLGDDERDFRLKMPQSRDCKITLDKSVREPNRYHPRIRTMLVSFYGWFRIKCWK